MTWITELTSAIATSLTSIGAAVFGFIKDGFVTLFLETDAQGAVTGVSAFGIFGFVAMGIALALGLTKFVTSIVRKRGN